MMRLMNAIPAITTRDSNDLEGMQRHGEAIETEMGSEGPSTATPDHYHELRSALRTGQLADLARGTDQSPRPPKGLLTMIFRVELLETEETIRLTVWRMGHDPETFFLDSDDDQWVLELDDLTGELRLLTSTNGDFA